MQPWSAVQIDLHPSAPRRLFEKLSSVSFTFPPSERHTAESCERLRVSRLLSDKSSDLSAAQLRNRLTMPMPSSHPTPLPLRSSICSVSLPSSKYQSARRPTIPKLEPSAVENFQALRRLASNVPSWPAAMRHVLFMYALFKKAAATTSLSQPFHEGSSTTERRCSANKPSWKERCLNWYTAGSASVGGSSILMSATPYS